MSIRDVLLKKVLDSIEEYYIVQHPDSLSDAEKQDLKQTLLRTRKANDFPGTTDKDFLLGLFEDILSS